MLAGDNERRKDKNASAFFSVMGRRFCAAYGTRRLCAALTAAAPTGRVRPLRGGGRHY
jgi:hypothetical protein